MSLSFLLIRLYIPFAIGYVLSFLLRVINGAITPYLIQDLGINAEQLGLLSAGYFLSFALAQLPLGIYLDIIGARKVEATLLLVAVLGCIIFATTDNFWGLFLGRVLIGLGVSACLMAAFKAYSVWLSVERLNLVNSLQMLAGGLGAVFGTAPVELALQYTDWRGVFWGLALLLLMTSLLIYSVVPEKETTKPNLKNKNHVKDLLRIFKSKEFWQVAPLTVITQATSFSLIFLWAAVYLNQIAGFSNATTNYWISLSALAMTIGFAVVGFGSDYLVKYMKIPLHIIAFIAQMAIFTTLIAVILLPAAKSIYAWVIMGFFMGSNVLNYSYLTQKFPINMSGKVNTALNLSIFLGSFFMQWFIGVIIDIYSNTHASSYNAKAFMGAFIIVGGMIMLCTMQFIYAYIGAKNKNIAI